MNTKNAFLAFCFAVAASTMACAAPTAEATDSTEEDISKARFTSKKTPTDPDLKAFYAAGGKFEGAYRGVYRFNKATNESTSADARMRRVKEVMHRYMCSFFDESIDLGRSTGSKKVKITLDDLDMTNNGNDQDADVTALGDAIGTLFDNENLDVMSGSASGNNTMGEIMGVYDEAHDEIVFFGFTNCGSDD